MICRELNQVEEPHFHSGVLRYVIFRFYNNTIKNNNKYKYNFIPNKEGILCFGVECKQ